MSKEEFILKVMDKGKDYLDLVLTFLIGWHLKQPNWVKKKEEK